MLLYCLVALGCNRPSPGLNADPEETPKFDLVTYQGETGEILSEVSLGPFYLRQGSDLDRDPLVFVQSDEQGSHPALVRFDPKTGKELSHFPITAEFGDDEDPSRQEFFLATHDLQGRFDPKTGAPADQPRDLPGRPLAILGSLVYCADPDSLIAFDTETWQTLWKTAYAGSHRAAVFEDGTVAALNPNGVALWSRSGKSLWSFEVPNPPDALAVEGDTVFVSTAKPALYALEKSTGKVRWTKTWSEMGMYLPLKLDNNRVLYRLGSKTLSIESTKGEVMWEFPGAALDWSLDSKTRRGVLVTAVAAESTLKLVNLDTGKSLRDIAVKGRVEAVTLKDGKVYALVRVNFKPAAKD